MPMHRDQNIFASFPAWCQWQNMWDLQIALWYVSLVKGQVTLPFYLALLALSRRHHVLWWIPPHQTKTKSKYERIWEAAQLWSCPLPYYLRKMKTKQMTNNSPGKPTESERNLDMGESYQFYEADTCSYMAGQPYACSHNNVLRDQQWKGCSHSWQIQTHTKVFLLFSVVSEGRATDSGSFHTGLCFNIAPFYFIFYLVLGIHLGASHMLSMCFYHWDIAPSPIIFYFKYLVLGKELSFWTMTLGTVHQGNKIATTDSKYSLMSSSQEHRRLPWLSHLITRTESPQWATKSIISDNEKNLTSINLNYIYYITSTPNPKRYYVCSTETLLMWKPSFMLPLILFQWPFWE
jgi:hypothetical protein